MNTPIQTTTKEGSGYTGDWQPRPALRDAMQQIASITVDDETVLVSDRSITFQSGFERTTISVEPTNVDTVDGLRIAEIVTICTPLTGYKLFDENRYAIVNIFATTGAIVRDVEGKDAIVSRLPLFEGDDEALADLYTPLVANASRLQMVGLLSGFHRIQGAGTSTPQPTSRCRAGTNRATGARMSSSMRRSDFASTGPMPTLDRPA